MLISALVSGRRRQAGGTGRQERRYRLQPPVQLRPLPALHPLADLPQADHRRQEVPEVPRAIRGRGHQVWDHLHRPEEGSAGQRHHSGQSRRRHEKSPDEESPKQKSPNTRKVHVQEKS